MGSFPWTLRHIQIDHLSQVYGCFCFASFLAFSAIDHSPFVPSSFCFRAAKLLKIFIYFSPLFLTIPLLSGTLLVSRVLSSDIPWAFIQVLSVSFSHTNHNHACSSCCHPWVDDPPVVSLVPSLEHLSPISDQWLMESLIQDDYWSAVTSSTNVKRGYLAKPPLVSLWSAPSMDLAISKYPLRGSRGELERAVSLF